MANGKVTELQRFIVKQLRRLLGFGTLLILLYAHVFLDKDIETRIIAIPGLIMGIPISSVLSGLSKINEK